jgi:hypothetical protein
MSEGQVVERVDAFEAIAAAVAEQPFHAVVPKVRVRRRGEGLEVLYDVAFGGDGTWVGTTLAGVGRMLQGRAGAIERMEADHFHDGYVPPAWDEIVWEICKLRVRNPGIVIQPAVFGANGAGKTFFAEWFMMHFLVHSKNLTAWSFSLDEPNSEAVNQKWAHWYSPNEYHTEKGSVRRTATAKYNYNEAGGFTDNKFSFHNGCTCEFRFYTKDIGTNEGVRPAFVWMDEEFQDAWLDAVERRLVTYAGKTRDHMGMWQRLLAEKRVNPALKFPREKMHLLALGVQLITFTCKKGYTPTVRAFVKGATTVREIAAELLPRKDALGNTAGHEMVPKLQYGADPKRLVYYLHAWDNPVGGNWEGMQVMARNKSRKEILWWCYGVTEETSGVMWPKFSWAAHVRPLWMLPPSGTWYHVADPNDGKRNWSMTWSKVNALGEVFMAWEWPKQDDFIPGEGHVGPWAVAPTGRRADGDVGPAQGTFGRGFQFVADEIGRVERVLYWVEKEMERRRREVSSFKFQVSSDTEREDAAAKARARAREIMEAPLEIPVLPLDAPRIKVETRYMDARAGNTETMTHGASITLIERMAEEYDLDFEPVDKDHGAVEGSGRSVGHGAKLVEDALDYDETQAVMESDADGNATGRLTFKGKAPRLYICGEPPRAGDDVPRGCANTIFAMETWTNKDGGEGACKDFADQPRYLMMMDACDLSQVQWSSGVRDGAGGRPRNPMAIGDWKAGGGGKVES